MHDAKRMWRRALLHPSVIVWNHGGNLGLLEHDFGDPYLCRNVEVRFQTRTVANDRLTS